MPPTGSFRSSTSVRANGRPLEIDGQEGPLPEAVLRHFRDVRNVKALSAGTRVEVVETPFIDRRKYSEVELEAIAQLCADETCVVFLNTDTGLAPCSAGFEHVLASELREI